MIAAQATFAGTTDDGIDDSHYLAYGERFADYTKVCAVVDSDGTLSLSTAVLLADQWAITAAHVVLNAATAVVDGHRVDRVFVHHEFDPNHVGRNDIAMLRLAERFSNPWYPPISTDPANEHVGDVCLVAGFGIHGPLSQGYRDADGRLRAGTQTIERFENGVIVCLGRRRSSAMEMLISPGDSGGPLFLDGRLAGINSFTSKDADGKPLRSREGEESGHTRVSLHAEWIRGVMESER